MEKTTLIVAEDHLLVREGIIQLLQREPGLEVVAEVGDGRSAVEAAAKYQPDMILMDINMPIMDGIAATREIKRSSPQIKIIALTIYEDEEVVQMIKAGVSAYMLKDVAGHELIDTVRQVRGGGVVLHPRVAKHVIQEVVEGRPPRSHIHLTRRELDVLGLLVQGKSNKDISVIMHISEKTVKNHLTSIFRKLAVRDRTQAVLYALRSQLFKGNF
jgi:DNA-binding NarL/FixJ family response regulator